MFKMLNYQQNTLLRCIHCVTDKEPLESTSPKACKSYFSIESGFFQMVPLLMYESIETECASYYPECWYFVLLDGE